MESPNETDIIISSPDEMYICNVFIHYINRTIQDNNRPHQVIDDALAALQSQDYTLGLGEQYLVLKKVGLL